MVCDKIVCDKELCDKFVCDKDVCDKVVCERWCDKVVCVCVTGRRRRGRRTRRSGTQNKKQEPHTKMWGKSKKCEDTSFLHFSSVLLNLLSDTEPILT